MKLYFVYFLLIYIYLFLSLWQTLLVILHLSQYDSYFRFGGLMRVIFHIWIVENELSLIFSNKVKAKSNWRVTDTVLFTVQNFGKC